MIACKMQIFSYFENVYLSIFGFAYLCILLHIYAYGWVFWHIRAFLAFKANQFNKYSAATGVRRERSFFRLLSLLFFLCFNSPLTLLNVPKVDDLVFGKVVASDVDSGKCRGSRQEILVSSCLLYFIYLPNFSSASSL